MALTVNPDAGASAPDTFREEGIYAFRFDLDDAWEDRDWPGQIKQLQGRHNQKPDAPAQTYI
jgi:hypothetical protein